MTTRREFLLNAAATLAAPALPIPAPMEFGDAIREAQKIWGKHATAGWTEPAFDTNHGARFTIGMNDGKRQAKFYGTSWEDAFATFRRIQGDKKFQEILGESEDRKAVYGS